MPEVSFEPRAGAKVPALKGYPLVGVLPRFRSEPFATLVGAAGEAGEVARVDFPLQKFVFMSRPEHVERVLGSNAHNYIKGYDRARFLLGNGLVTNEGESWLRQRRLMQPAFSRKRLAGFAATMVEEAEKMLDGWESAARAGRALEIHEQMTLLSQRIIVRTMFGADVGAEGQKIARAFDVAMRGIEIRHLLPLWFGKLPLPANRRFARALATLDEAVHRIIHYRRAAGSGGGDDLLGMLLSARDEETGKAMDDRQLRDEVITVYLAGHETTAATLAWFFYLLSKNPEAARKVREEVREVLGDRPPGARDLSHLLYTRMVLDETLRLYPPAWVISRRALADDEIGGYHIPAGSEILLSPYVTHRRTDLWLNPEGFDPERFRLEGNGAGEGVVRRPRYAYFPFGGGSRQCIGQNFALMEATLVVAAVMRRYQLDLVPGREVRPKLRGTLKPHPAVWMSPRSPAGAVAR